jgi:isoquinoline 1-oxidoreductase beta subunit
MNQMLLDRRRFLISASVVAGGMALSLSLAEAAPTKAPTGDFCPWLAITADDWVVIHSPTPEIGNGSMTQIAMNIAEELECDWSRIRIEPASPSRDYLENGVYSAGWLPFFSGHSTVKERLQRCTQLGASARERLKAAAAKRWKVDVSEVSAKDGVLSHKGGDRTLRFGEVAAEAAAIKLAAEPAPKKPENWTLLGKATPSKLHLPQVVHGTAVYGIDVKVPGMVHAALRQSPVHGGKLKSYDASAVLKMPGVRAVVVVDPAKSKKSPVKIQAQLGIDDSAAQSAVAVIADHYWQAKTALDALPVVWDPGPGAGKSSDDLYAGAAATVAKGAGEVGVQTGDVAKVTGGKTLEATYHTPLCENATMEPLNGTARYAPDGVELWYPGQDAQQAMWVVVDETGFTPDKVQVHQTLVGGGFGRRSTGVESRMIVAVAREYPGVPVKVIWSREETFRQGRYRTPITTHLQATLDDKGMPQALKAEACYSGLVIPIGYLTNPYVLSGAIPNVRLASSNYPIHVLTGAYRAPCYNSHVFFVEGFIDECAEAAGIDPLDYRLRLLGKWDASWARCLKLAAEKSGWGQPLPKGQGRGIAISSWPIPGELNTIVCAAIRVTVSREGVVKVDQVDMTFDSGNVANRDAVKAQMESAAIFALNSTLKEEITVRDGAVVEGNFNHYPMLRIGDIPQINVHFEALSGTDRFGIMGEAPVGPVPPALAGAIFQATGKRLRSTPFRKHDLSWA